MGDNPEVEGQQTTSESTVDESGSQPSEAELLSDLRRRKRICKSQLTKSKLYLTSLLCSSTRDVDGIRSAVDSVLRYQEEVIDILNNLCDISVEFENELDTVQSDGSIADVLSKATDWLGHVSSDTSHNTSYRFANLQQAQNAQDESSNGNSGISLQHGTGNPNGEQPSNFSQIDRDLHRQLSKVSINKFNGNKREYQVFKDTFMECIDKSSCSKAYKMLQLRQHLTGDALKCIEGFPASELGYDSALRRLHDKFGGQRRQTLIHLDTIRMMKPVSFNDIKRFEKFVDALELCILSLQENGRTEEFEVDSMFFCVVRSKLTTSCLMQFKRWAANSKKNESLVTLHEWLAHEVRYRIESNEEIVGFSATSDVSKTVSSNYQRSHFRNDKHSKTYATNSVDSKLCVVCHQDHEQGISNCPYFRTLSVSQRWRVAKEKRLCFRCLGNSHIGNRCTASQQCSIGECTRTHHFLLHGGGSGNVQNIEAPRSNVSLTESSVLPSTDRSKLPPQKHTHTQITHRASLVMRVVPIIVGKYDRMIRCNALLDDCSTDSYINEHIAAHLGLQGEIRDLDVCVLGGKSSCLNSTLVSAELCSLDRKVCIPFSAFTVKNVTGNLRTVDWNRQSKFWSHLQDIPFPCIDDTRVDMLIGLNVPGVHRAITEIAGLPGEPVARLTPLGWTCIGPADPHCSIASNFAHFAYFIKTESDIDSLLRQSWELEAAGVQSSSLHYSKSELEAVKSTEDTLSYDPIEKRYTVGVPWKSNRELLVSNYESAETRLFSLERSLSKRPEVCSQYSENIRQHIVKGYITEVQSHSLPSWYLPHFAVVRMDKSTSKVRMVLDAAARSNGLSLNDCVNPGPKLQRELLDVLLRFRNKPIALASDISEMFLQIKLKEDDSKFHRILWRDMDPLRPVKIYQYNRLVFGNSSSPFLSQTVLREHCKRNLDEYPLAAQSILESMYVDDLLDSVDTLSEAIDLRRELTSLLSSAGFEIRKWLSNKPEVLSDIPISDRLNKLSLEDGNLPSVKTLGILWKAENDLFTFEYTEPSFDRLTKRVVVSKTASLFDPLTLIAPFTIRAKLGIQKIWVRGLDWDDELPDDLGQQWRLWFSELALLSSIAIPRCLIKDGSEIVNKTLHVFVDASEKAYAACCYIRCEYRDESVSNVLVVAKTRVAPLKTVSIPKLELCGAVLGARLSVTVREVLSIPKESLTFWCDSQNVLYWIKGESRSYKPFVSHRVGEIHELTEPIQWRYVPTKQNSADLATRGMSVVELAKCDMWWSGPEFLADITSEWPERVIPEPEEVAISEVRSKIRETFLVRVKDLGRLDPSRFSNWTRFVRVTAWVLRFIFNTRKQNTRVSNSTLSVEELQNSTFFWIKHAQNETFASEIDCIQKTNHVRSNSKLISLNPCLDAQGLLRVGGRIGNSKHIEYDAKFPIILPGNHVISRHIVCSYHEKHDHDIGISHLLSLLRTKFWIVGGRNLVKSVKSHCTECSRRRRKPAAQVMAPLPEYRLGSPLRAFARVGVDYAGPFLTKQGRGKSRVKRYLCLFTCLATRAVHLEMSWSMDTESFLCAFSRFSNRRGKPLSVLSDNGTNFVGAERELKDLLLALDQSKINDSLANSKIKWNFNPPLSPHFGGVFEAMIKSAKRAIRAIIGTADVTDEELLSAFTKAEGLINSRPLCYQGDDPQDDPVLTPNNFIFGQVSGQLAPESVDEMAFNPRKRWRHVQEIVSQFWKRWMRELLPLLNSRKKWNRVHRDFVEGDIAIVVDPSTPRGKWPLGRIVKIYRGSDDHVRVVDIKVGDKIYKRSLSHLCPLDV